MSGEAAVAQPRPGYRPTVRLANNLIQEATANTSDEPLRNHLNQANAKSPRTVTAAPRGFPRLLD